MKLKVKYFKLLFQKVNLTEEKLIKWHTYFSGGFFYLSFFYFTMMLFLEAWNNLILGVALTIGCIQLIFSTFFYFFNGKFLSPI